MTFATFRAAAEHIARAGTITPHQLAAWEAAWEAASDPHQERCDGVGGGEEVAHASGSVGKRRAIGRQVSQQRSTSPPAARNVAKVIPVSMELELTCHHRATGYHRSAALGQ